MREDSRTSRIHSVKLLIAELAFHLMNQSMFLRANETGTPNMQGCHTCRASIFTALGPSRRVDHSTFQSTAAAHLLAPLLLDPHFYFAFKLSVIYQVLLCQRCSASNTMQHQTTAPSGLCSGLTNSLCRKLSITQLNAGYPSMNQSGKYLLFESWAVPASE